MKLLDKLLGRDEVPESADTPELIEKNFLNITLKNGKNICFGNSDEKMVGTPNKAFSAFIKWYFNPKSLPTHCFHYDKGMRVLLKSEISTFDIHSVD